MPEIFEELEVPLDLPDSVELSLDKDVTERFLGFTWNWVRDTLKLKISKEIPTQVQTKRELLRSAASIYDPLDLSAVVKLQPKILFQETCRQGLDWDEPLDERIAASWEKWASQVPRLTDLEIPRCIEPLGFAHEFIELHVFAEASENAFGAAAYSR